MTLGNLIFNGAGVVEGLLLATAIGRLMRKTAGVLKIDHSNPEKDVYRFEIADLDGLSKKKHIVLRVDNSADLSQD